MTREREHPLARPRTIRALRIASGALLALVLAAELFVERHPHFEVEGPFGFYAVFGFASCVVMVLVARIIGRLLKRTERYYRE